MDLLIKGGKVVTAKSTFKADVAVKNGKISAIGTNLKPEPGTEVVDAKGKLVLPGAIDGHTHMAMPFGGTISTEGKGLLSLLRMSLIFMLCVVVVRFFRYQCYSRWPRKS